MERNSNSISNDTLVPPAHLSQVTSGSAYGETARLLTRRDSQGVRVWRYMAGELLTQAAIPDTQIRDQGTVVATFPYPGRHTPWQKFIVAVDVDDNFIEVVRRKR